MGYLDKDHFLNIQFNSYFLEKTSYILFHLVTLYLEYLRMSTYTQQQQVHIPKSCAGISNHACHRTHLWAWSRFKNWFLLTHVFRTILFYTLPRPDWSILAELFSLNLVRQKCFYTNRRRRRSLICLDGEISVTRLGIGLWATFQSLWQQLICPNLPHSQAIFCKNVKIYHFSSEIIFAQLLQTFGNFFLVTLNSCPNF